MPASAALGLLAALESGGVRACLAGGWAVDALLGTQTRPHSDLDLWIPAVDAAPLFVVLAAEGIDRLHPWPDDRPWNFVVHDGRQHRIDLHFYEELGDGRIHYGSVVNPFVLTEADLSGHGVIDGTPVRCESPPFAVRSHSGYPPRDIDRQDMAALCERFGVKLPAGY